MEIPHSNLLKQDAARALSRGREPKKVITAYAGATALIAAITTVANYWLGLQIDSTGGLSNLGTRAIFSTAQTVLPMVQAILLMCLELGYLHAMMRIARGQYADQTDLKVGFQRLWPMLRMMLLQAFLYFGIGMVAFYFSMQIFMLTPWSEPLMDLLLPIVNSTTVLDPSYVLDDATMMQATRAMVPMLIMYLVIYGVVSIIMNYWFRMANYALLDNPHAGAFAAMRSSRRMMRRNCFKLLKLDLSFWWFHLLSVLAAVIAYGDVILAMLGVELPFNATVGYFVFYGLYLAAQFVITYFLRNQVESTYVMAYESICERPQDNGTVLGNIFDM